MIRHDRTGHSEDGLTNPETLGFVPTELLLLRSHDRGGAWTGPDAITPPLAGPACRRADRLNRRGGGMWWWGGPR